LKSCDKFDLSPDINGSRFFFGIAACAELLNPLDAGAHLVTTGMGPVYDGIGHLLLTPEDLIPAMAVALSAGLRGKDPGRQTLFLLASQYICNPDFSALRVCH
jgi:hypothetical protein